MREGGRRLIVDLLVMKTGSAMIVSYQINYAQIFRRFGEYPVIRVYGSSEIYS